MPYRPSAVLRRYRPLAEIGGFRRLLAISVFARMPIGLESLAILLLVRQTSGSYAVAGLATGVFALSSAAGVPVLSGLIDRYAPRRVLPIAAVVHAAMLVAIAVAAPLGVHVAVVVGLCVLGGATVPPVSSTTRTLWPQIARDHHERDAIFALDAITQEIIWIAGPLISAFVATTWSPVAAVLIAAGVVLVGTALFVARPIVRAQEGRSTPRTPGGALASPRLRLALPTVVLAGFGIGIVEVALPALSEDLGATWSTGPLLALWAGGSAVGGLVLGSRSWAAPLTVRYRWLLLLAGLVTLPMLLVSTPATALLLGAVAGLGIAPVLATQNALVGELAPAGAQTEAFGWATSALVGGIAAGSALGGSLADADLVTLAFAASTTAMVLGAAMALLLDAGPGDALPVHG